MLWNIAALDQNAKIVYSQKIRVVVHHSSLVLKGGLYEKSNFKKEPLFEKNLR